MEDLEGVSKARTSGDRQVDDKPTSSKRDSRRPKPSKAARRGDESPKCRHRKVNSRKAKVNDSHDANNEHSDGDSSDSSTDSSGSEDDRVSDAKYGITKSSRKSKDRKEHSKGKKRSNKNKKKAEKRDAAESDSLSDSDSDDDETGPSDSANAPKPSTVTVEERLATLEGFLSSMAIQSGQNDMGLRNSNDQGRQGLLFPGQSDDMGKRPSRSGMLFGPGSRPSMDEPQTSGSKSSSENVDTQKTPSRPEFKRVDSVWDASQFRFKLQDSADSNSDAQYDGYVFHVRRTFDTDGKYMKTHVDIKSKLLRECLQDVIKNVQGISLVDETPKLDPNMLYLYVGELRAHLLDLKWLEPAGETRKERKKNQKRLDDKRKHLKVLIKYIDKDYAEVKNCLEPMLQSGLITYDYLWALWKPGTLTYGRTYDSSETPRVFKMDISYEDHQLGKGHYYCLHGKYLEYDGKRFGYGTVYQEIPEFQGARKITSLPCYPLAYRKDEAEMRASLIERGKKFVALSGAQFKAYTGIAFMKRKKGEVLKFNISNSRIMVDPAIFRRVNANYPLSSVKPKSHVILTLEDDSSDEDGGCGCGGGDSSQEDEEGGGSDRTKYVTQFFKDEKGEVHMVRMPKDEISEDEIKEVLDELPDKNGDDGETAKNDARQKRVEDRNENGSSSSDSPKASSKSATDDQGEAKTPDSSTPDEEGNEATEREAPSFTDEEYLIASPLVLGFSFAEKQWLEFDVAKVKDIKWNEDAWGSLVLKPDTKDLIKALIESRKYNAATTIDDVIQGKGKGLVTVLHGPPGTGKTLTAEGISELLKCPLYMVSAGELGTDSRFLEHELQKILDICHTWGAILLLDEADVFLEQRNMMDIHRNALVSVFLRQLEYFQGILFLTTNRVQTFDDAFQSRIHVALRYDKLDLKAKRAIFKLFIDRVQAHGKLEVQSFTEDDLKTLAKNDLNGREIKNVIGSAQDMAINKGEALSMRHIRLVLDVHAKFGQDLKGGTGFEDAMRSYC